MASKKNVWSPQEQQILFISHASMGSKWAAIAGRLPGKDQNAIKNKFYSTLRRGHRKINSYITDVKRRVDPVRNRACKTIHDIFISKLIAVVDRSHEEKYEVKPAALALATGIEKMLIEVACKEDYQEGHAGDYKLEQALLQDILEFNKNCKKRKGKRNASEKKKVKSEEEIEQSQIITDSNNGIIKMQQKSQKANVKAEQQAQKRQAQPNFEGFSFLSKLQRKQSTSTVVKVNNFAMMANYFKDSIEQKLPCEQLIQSANNMTHSSCLKEEKTGWMYDSISSQLSVPRFVPNYLTEPSPSPNDPYCPFTFNNIMKSKNISGNNMFEDQISCNNDSQLAYSSFYQKDGLSYLTKPHSGEFLIKSADLLREMIQENPALTSSMKIEKDQLSAMSVIFQQIDQKQFKRNVAYQSQYAFQPETPPLSQAMFATFAVQPTSSDEKPLHQS